MVKYMFTQKTCMFRLVRKQPCLNMYLAMFDYVLKIHIVRRRGYVVALLQSYVNSMADLLDVF